MNNAKRASRAPRQKSLLPLREDFLSRISFDVSFKDIFFFAFLVSSPDWMIATTFDINGVEISGFPECANNAKRDNRFFCLESSRLRRPFFWYFWSVDYIKRSSSKILIDLSDLSEDSVARGNSVKLSEKFSLPAARVEQDRPNGDCSSRLRQ